VDRRLQPGLPLGTGSRPGMIEPFEDKKMSISSPMLHAAKAPPRLEQARSEALDKPSTLRYSLTA
jgi:hypothetical protein